MPLTKHGHNQLGNLKALTIEKLAAHLELVLQQLVRKQIQQALTKVCSNWHLYPSAVMDTKSERGLYFDMLKLPRR